MNKFYGKIGYGIVGNPVNGICTETIEERNYYGDIIRNIRRSQSGDKVNDDVNISNQISIVADPFAMTNTRSMRYVIYLGTKWKINSVEVQYPRLILELGGVYNGEQA